MLVLLISKSSNINKIGWVNVSQKNPLEGERPTKGVGENRTSFYQGGR